MNSQKKMRLRIFRHILVMVVPGTMIGCLSPQSHGGRDADASIAGIRAEVREMSAALAKFETRLNAGGDISTNDAWTLRLLGLGIMLLGLSYPVGKIVWLAIIALRRKTDEAVGAASRPADTAGLRDYLALKERRAEMLIAAGRPSDAAPRPAPSLTS